MPDTPDPTRRPPSTETSEQMSTADTMTIKQEIAAIKQRLDSSDGIIRVLSTAKAAYDQERQGLLRLAMEVRRTSNDFYYPQAVMDALSALSDVTLEAVGQMEKDDQP